MKLTAWLFVVAWLGGIFYLSHQSAPLGVTAGEQEAIAAHLGLYGGLAAVLTWALFLAAPNQRLRIVWATVAFLLAVLYGLSDEYHQSFIAGRTASAEDVGLDATGAILGVAFALFLAQLLFSRRKR